MIRTLLILPFLAFYTNAQDLTRSQTYQPDSIYFKNRGVHVILSPLVPGISVNTDNNYQFNTVSSRLLVSWMTKKTRKFSWFASIGTGSANGSKSMNFYESGFLLSYLKKGRRKGYFDLNVGLSVFGRKPKDPWLSIGWGPSSPKEELVEKHTVGIPFDFSVNTARGLLGIGVGIAGNLNLNQPYAGINLRFRFGNPIHEKYSTLKRNRSSRIARN